MWLTKRHRQRGYIAGLVVAIVTIAAAALVLFNRVQILDQLAVWQYQPTEEISQLAERSGMDERGRFYFYASQPRVLDAEAFNQECARKEEGTAVLGCYNGRYIYIYDVSIEQLDGIKEVTAAHEMLHAVYARLSNGEKQRLNGLLEVEFAKFKDDKKWAERIAFYERTEPGERSNELHSIIGTEVRNIDPELEEHYRIYFADRSKTVGLYEKYIGVFNDLESRSSDLAHQLDALRNQIEQATVAYNADVAQLNAEVEAFNARADRGDFISEAQFQAERSGLVARADALEGRRQAIDQDIARYDSLRKELLSIAAQSEALTKSIDSTLVPAPNL